MSSQEEQPLARLVAFFSSLPVEIPAPAREILAPVREMERDLTRPLGRITLFGASKTGKTALLNALLGTKLLPEQARLTDHRVTELTYGPAPEAVVAEEDRTERPLPFDELLRAWARWDEASVREVRIALPLPLLANGITLVDTPGLLADEAATEMTYRALERTDLAIMVLAADKILSAEERSVAAYVHDLLHGNILFVVNRMDLIDEEDRGDVLEWAGIALREVGNPLVGESRILVAGRDMSSASPNGLQSWLATFCRTDVVAAVSALSRASVLGHHLRGAIELLKAEQARVAARTEGERLRHLERIMRKRASMRHAVDEARRRLETAHAAAGALKAPFIARCTRDTLEWLRAHPGAAHARLQLEGAVADYAAGVNEEAAAAILDAPITAPTFDLSTWVFRLDVDARTDQAGAVGGTIGNLLTRPLDHGKSGREAGAALGSWLSKNVLGKDAAAETQRKIEGLARAAFTSIEAEAERYFGRLRELLEEADTFYETWAEPAPEVDAAEEEERRWAELAHWSGGLLHATERTIAEAIRARPEGVSERSVPGRD